MSIGDAAVHAVRQKLYAFGIPTASFIDDHVGNLAYFLNIIMREVEKVQAAEDNVAREAAITKLLETDAYVRKTMADTLAENIAAGRVPDHLL